LIEESLWVVAAPSAGLSRKRALSFSRIAREPFVLPAAPQGLRAVIEHAAAEAGVTLRVFAETNALSVQKELVAQDHGWTILPAVCVRQEVEGGLLCAAPLAAPGLQRTIVLAAPSSRQATAPVRCVVGVLLDCARTTFGQGHWPDAHWLG
jgi:DNA-binding transcriptional LysR family regulator